MKPGFEYIRTCIYAFHFFGTNLPAYVLLKYYIFLRHRYNILFLVIHRLNHPSKGFRMEGILFSGYKLDSVQSVTPSGTDYAFGSAADRLWFTFANVSINLCTCVMHLNLHVRRLVWAKI